MPEFFKQKQNIISAVLIFLAFSGGIYIGISKGDKLSQIKMLSNSTPSEEVDFTSFWKVWNAIDEKYPDASSISNEDRMNGAVAGLVESLNDPYSTYFDKEETKSFEEDIAGNFTGIGMEIDIKDDILTVVAPLKDTPAYKAGIKPGDKILKIGDLITSDISVEKAISLIRGDKGTSVTLTLFTEGDLEPRELSIIRDVINIPTLDTELRKDGIFVIKLYSFSANSANLFRNAMKEFYKSKTDKLLLDMRGNPGGYLDSAVDMASWFLPSGKPVVIEDSGNGKDQDIYRSAGYDIFNDQLKFVILIDGGSASASEILAGAMQDYGKAKLVGTQSYGKGSVQEVVEVTPDTILKITIAKWLTPKGNSISDKGLTPDYVVEMSREDFKNGHDLQTDKAVDLLKNWPTN